MINKIPFSLWLKCEHCGHKTVLFRDFAETESKCANGMGCAKISKLDEDEKLSSYIDFLEDRAKSLGPIWVSQQEKSYFVKTKSGGSRLINNNFNSIQWAMSERIEDLK